MPKKSPLFVLHAFKNRTGELRLAERYSCKDEDQIFRRGLAMADRVSGMAFFRIETSASGDVWEEVELLATHGHVPEEAA
ncbi:MAG: hypothetical protein LCH57_01800 [Proteobacteria bacterium]|nr:hypothetical protein [Pseudomonadota bacterium]